MNFIAPNVLRYDSNSLLHITSRSRFLVLLLASLEKEVDLAM